MTKRTRRKRETTSGRTALTHGEIMARVTKRNTRLELRIRKLLYKMGYRFRIHGANLPGTPDIIFTRRRVAIFTHGCFWHQHGCDLTRKPKTNLAYWTPKLARNKERDRQSERALRAEGWRVITVWECETDERQLQRKLKSVLGQIRYEGT